MPNNFKPAFDTPPQITLPIIGFVRSPLTQKFGVPRQPNLVQIPTFIEFIPPYDNPLAFDGLEQFSHLWVIWQFHQNKKVTVNQDFSPQVRPPRLGGNQKIGVFATRSMYRPANIGLSVVKIDKLTLDPPEYHRDNLKVRLHILGGDMVDGTPVLDIKPYISYSDSIDNAISGYAEHKPQPKQVTLSQNLQNQLVEFAQNNQLTVQDIGLITQLLAQDPRPAYRQQEWQTPFTMRYRQFDCTFYQVNEQTLVWDAVKLIDIS